jgi:hypothetical protein
MRLRTTSSACDRIYRSVVTRRLRAVGIRDKPIGRYAIASGPEILSRLLQLRQNASILEQGSAGFSPGSANRCDQFTRHPGRASSPLRPRLSCRYTHEFEMSVPRTDSSWWNRSMSIAFTL